jgi:LPS-assembly lipoprotein
MHRRLAMWLLPSLAVLAAGCGFHLQGASVLPGSVERVHVVTRDELSAFSIELFRGLDRAGAQRVASAAEADAVIRVRTDRSQRRVLSVSARNTPQEFEIVYQIVYSIEAGGSEVVPPQSLELTRSISFDESQLLAKDREEEILRDAMARELADLVLRRLASLPPAPTSQSDPSR